MTRQPPCPFCGERHSLEDTCLSPRAISREELEEQPIRPLPIFVLESTEKAQPVSAPEISTLPTVSVAIRQDEPQPTAKDTLEGYSIPEDIALLSTLPPETPTTCVDPPAETAPTEIEPDRAAETLPTDEPSASDLGGFVGDYELVEKLGEGGMGRIFRARNARVGKEAAIKILKPEASSDEGVVRRFFQEARVVNEIHHENVIDILDLGRTKHGEYFLLMELLRGETLHHALEAVPFSKGRLLHIALQLCAGLQACHQRGIAHRDLKSENIFLLKRGAQTDFVKILDFGLAKLYNANIAALEVSVAGSVFGTPICMSPEQACGEEIDHQTDIYALGVLLYQMATGRPPFYDPNPMALLKMHLMIEPIPPSKRGSSLGKAFDSIVLRCLEKERKRRYRSIEEVSKALAKLR